MMKLRTMVLILAAMTLGIPAQARQNTRSSDDIPILHVQGNVYMLVGLSGNATVQIGEDGVLVADTTTEASADKLLAAIRKLSPKPIRWIVNTHVHRDRTGGNAMLGSAGKFFAGNTRRDVGALIVAHDNVLQSMVPATSKYQTPSQAWPTDTYFGSKDIFFNGEPVQLYHQPNAHTSGDTIVLFRRSDVVSTGDIFTPDRFPVIDLEEGGEINGLLAGLNRIIQLTVPEVNEEGGTMVIPGTGHLCDQADVADYRDMVTIVRDRVQDLVNKGRTLDEIKRARPTRDYDPLYGRPEYTGDMFVEAVYRSLTKSASK
jgi:glyoxylase-like metal-dependent hydrolase (beta-lactamase superfamily II)